MLRVECFSAPQRGAIRQPGVLDPRTMASAPILLAASGRDACPTGHFRSRGPQISLFLFASQGLAPLAVDFDPVGVGDDSPSFRQTSRIRRFGSRARRGFRSRFWMRLFCIFWILVSARERQEDVLTIESEHPN